MTDARTRDGPRDNYPEGCAVVVATTPSSPGRHMLRGASASSPGGATSSAAPPPLPLNVPTLDRPPILGDGQGLPKQDFLQMLDPGAKPHLQLNVPLPSSALVGFKSKTKNVRGDFRKGEEGLIPRAEAFATSHLDYAMSRKSAESRGVASPPRMNTPEPVTATNLVPSSPSPPSLEPAGDSTAMTHQLAREAARHTAIFEHRRQAVLAPQEKLYNRQLEQIAEKERALAEAVAADRAHAIAQVAHDCLQTDIIEAEGFNVSLLAQPSVPKGQRRKTTAADGALLRPTPLSRPQQWRGVSAVAMCSVEHGCDAGQAPLIVDKPLPMSGDGVPTSAAYMAGTPMSAAGLLAAGLQGPLWKGLTASTDQQLGEAVQHHHLTRRLGSSAPAAPDVPDAPDAPVTPAVPSVPDALILLVPPARPSSRQGVAELARAPTLHESGSALGTESPDSLAIAPTLESERKSAIAQATTAREAVIKREAVQRLAAKEAREAIAAEKRAETVIADVAAAWDPAGGEEALGEATTLKAAAATPAAEVAAMPVVESSDVSTAEIIEAARALEDRAVHAREVDAKRQSPETETEAKAAVQDAREVSAVAKAGLEEYKATHVGRAGMAVDAKTQREAKAEAAKVRAKARAAEFEYRDAYAKKLHEERAVQEEAAAVLAAATEEKAREVRYADAQQTLAAYRMHSGVFAAEASVAQTDEGTAAHAQKASEARMAAAALVEPSYNGTVEVASPLLAAAVREHDSPFPRPHLDHLPQASPRSSQLAATAPTPVGAVLLAGTSHAAPIADVYPSTDAAHTSGPIAQAHTSPRPESMPLAQGAPPLSHSASRHVTVEGTRSAATKTAAAEPAACLSPLSLAAEPLADDASATLAGGAFDAPRLPTPDRVLVADEDMAERVLAIQELRSLLGDIEDSLISSDVRRMNGSSSHASMAVRCDKRMVSAPNSISTTPQLSHTPHQIARIAAAEESSASPTSGMGVARPEAGQPLIDGNGRAIESPSATMPSDGAGPLTDGAGPLTDGAGPHTDGARPLTDGAWPLSDGAWPLTDGAGPPMTPQSSSPLTSEETAPPLPASLPPGALLDAPTALGMVAPSDLRVQAQHCSDDATYMQPQARGHGYRGRGFVEEPCQGPEPPHACNSAVANAFASAAMHEATRIGHFAEHILTPRTNISAQNCVRIFRRQKRLSTARARAATHGGGLTVFEVAAALGPAPSWPLQRADRQLSYRAVGHEKGPGGGGDALQLLDSTANAHSLTGISAHERQHYDGISAASSHSCIAKPWDTYTSRIAGDKARADRQRAKQVANAATPPQPPPHHLKELPRLMTYPPLQNDELVDLTNPSFARLVDTEFERLAQRKAEEDLARAQDDLEEVAIEMQAAAAAAVELPAESDAGPGELALEKPDSPLKRGKPRPRSFAAALFDESTHGDASTHMLDDAGEDVEIEVTNGDSASERPHSPQGHLCDVRVDTTMGQLQLE